MNAPLVRHCTDDQMTTRRPQRQGEGLLMTGKHAVFMVTVVAMLACGAPPPFENEQQPARPGSSPAPAATSERRDFTKVDVCQLVPGPAVATALGGTFASSLRRTGPGTSGCAYTMNLPDGRQDVVLIWLAPPEQYDMLKTLEDGPVETLAGLGDDAYGRQETSEVAKVHAVRRGEASIDATASRVSDARKLAEVALAHVR
jgi:hypothetical protein